MNRKVKWSAREAGSDNSCEYPERLQTPILIMTNRKKVFTVLGLMFIRFAISLLERPCNSSSTACCSRRENLNAGDSRKKSNLKRCARAEAQGGCEEPLNAIQMKSPAAITPLSRYKLRDEM